MPPPKSPGGGFSVAAIGIANDRPQEYGTVATERRGGDIIATQQDTGAESLTALEAARKLGVDKSTVVRWLQDDKLAGYRTLGGHWRIPVAEVDRVRTTITD